ncbi:MAG: hypothetical protein ACLFNA_09435 [Halochromatium sp.]
MALRASAESSPLRTISTTTVEKHSAWPESGQGCAFIQSNAALSAMFRRLTEIQRALSWYWLNKDAAEFEPALVDQIKPHRRPFRVFAHDLQGGDQARQGLALGVGLDRQFLIA